MESAVGWLVTTPALQWDGAQLQRGPCQRRDWGRFALLGTGVPALTRPYLSRVFRTQFYGVVTVPEEIMKQGLGRAMAVWFDEACECTKLEDGKYVIVDAELLAWTFPDKTTIRDWQSRG
jgi:hypothetical protein